jgi:hypothetical protein
MLMRGATRVSVFIARAAAPAMLSLALALLAGSDALADGCTRAVKAFNAEVDRDASEYIADIKRTFGVLPKDVDQNLQTCPKLIPLWRARISRYERDINLFDQAERECKKISWAQQNPNPSAFKEKGGPRGPAAAIQATNASISSCEQMIAQAGTQQTAVAPRSGASSAPDRGSSCPPVAPAKNWQGTPNAAYCANANCVDRGSAYYGYMCFPPSSHGGEGSGTASAQPARHEAPPRFRRIAPDVRSDILGLADAIMDMPAENADRPHKLRRLTRLLSDNGVPVTAAALACLEPASGSSGRLIETRTGWRPYHIRKEAIDQSGLCDGVPEGDAKEACREAKFGEAVMWAVPEIAGQCRSANAPNFDPDAIADCARRRFLNAWANNNDGFIATPAPDKGPAECDRKLSPADRKNGLRDRLRQALATAADVSVTPPQAPSVQPLAASAPDAANAPPPPPPLTDDDEAYCNYMARAIVRGELTPSPATAIPPGCRATIEAAMALQAKQQSKPFSMDPDETDREIAKLMSPQSPGGAK